MTFVCAISGAVPQFPVVTPAGHIFERKLLISLLATNGGACPVTNAPLSEANLITIASGKIPAEAPSSATGAGFTGILCNLQSEWDALMLETYTLRLALDETRAELSQALYQNDAAVRVIARLTMERDQARASLASGEGATAAAPMDTEEPATEGGIPAPALEKMVATWSTLSGGRKKKAAPTADHVSATALSSFKEGSKKSLHKASGKTGISALAISADKSILASGGNDHQLVVFDKEAASVLATKSTGSKAVSSLSFHPTSAATVVTGNADGTVKVFGGDVYSEVSSTKLSNACVDISVQPTGDYYFAASAGGTVEFLTMDSSEVVATFTDESAYSAGALHPDGLIYAAAATDNLKIWDVKTSQVAAAIPTSGAATCIAFSENGYHFAAGDAAGVVSVFDLRKLKAIATIQGNGAITSVAFDDAAKYLAHTSAKGGAIHVVKEWEKSIFDIPEKKKSYGGFVWGKDAAWFATGNEDRVLSIYA